MGNKVGVNVVGVCGLQSVGVMVACIWMHYVETMHFMLDEGLDLRSPSGRRILKLLCRYSALSKTQ